MASSEQEATEDPAELPRQWGEGRGGQCAARSPRITTPDEQRPNQQTALPAMRANGSDAVLSLQSKHECHPEPWNPRDTAWQTRFSREEQDTRAADGQVLLTGRYVPGEGRYVALWKSFTFQNAEELQPTRQQRNEYLLCTLENEEFIPASGDRGFRRRSQSSRKVTATKSDTKTFYREDENST